MDAEQKIAKLSCNEQRVVEMSDSNLVLSTPVGDIGITVENNTLTGVDLEPIQNGNAVADPPGAVGEQLKTYFRNSRQASDIPMLLRGTPFQRRVWRALQAIPAGRTVTYGQLARELGTSARAVGGACRANPCPIVIPCHRVVARDGLGGFAGDTSGRKLEVKRWLLRHEGAAAAQ